MTEEIFDIVATLAIVAAVALALGFYGYIWRKEKVLSPSLSLMFGISGVATEGKLTATILRYEATVAVLVLAFAAKIVVGSAVLYKLLELVAGISLLICGSSVLQGFRRAKAAQ